MKRVIDNSLLQIVGVFSSITGASVHDCCIVDDTVVFVVSPGDVGKAVGSGGSNIPRLSRALNRKIKIVEFNSELEKFVENLVFPLKISRILVKDKGVTLVPFDYHTRGLLIGRNASELRLNEAVLERLFGCKSLRVSDGS